MITAVEIEAVIKKNPGTQKPWTGQFHRRILQNISGRANPYLSQSIAKNPRRGKTPQLLTRPASS